MLPTMAAMTDAQGRAVYRRACIAPASRPSRRPAAGCRFDRFMALALYEPGLGYYARGSRQFGAMPASGSDFVTAPELSPLFGARWRARWRRRSTPPAPTRCSSSAPARARWRRSCWRRWATACAATRSSTCPAALRAAPGRSGWRPGRERVRWLDAWPAALHGVVVGNEVLDAMPVQLLHWDGEPLVRARRGRAPAGAFAWADRADRAAAAGGGGRSCPAR